MSAPSGVELMQGIREAMQLIESLPPRVQCIRFRDKADMMHMLNEPQIVDGYRSRVETMCAIPVVFDPDVPPREYRIDY